MVQQRTETYRSWRPVTVLAAALLAAFAVTGVIASEAPLPVHGSVAAWAEEHPGEPVPLIVQHDGTPDDLLAFVTKSGGAIEREFHIIPALDVEVPAGLVDDLAGQGDVTWVSLDAPVQSTGAPNGFADSLVTAYPHAINAPQAWQTSTGAGVTVALVDTGFSQDAKEDLYDAEGAPREQWATTNSANPPDKDGFGHGTHVAGIIAGYSTKTNPVGQYIGIAPGANLLSVRIADDAGNATVGDLMAGLEFVDDNREAYNIQVLNLSVTSSVA